MSEPVPAVLEPMRESCDKCCHWEGCKQYGCAAVAYERELAAQQRAETPPELVGLPYGIVDPDYARAFTIIRTTAWSYGYAVAMQGSFTRDLDLLVVPWTEMASIGHEEMLRQFERTTGFKRIAGFSEKPKGRVSCSLALPGFADPRWIDISFIPAPALATPPERAETPQASPAPRSLNLLDLSARWKCSGGRMEQDRNGPWVQYVEDQAKGAAQPDPATFIDQFDAEQHAATWLGAMIPEGLERVFWQLSHLSFDPQDGRVMVLRAHDRIVAVAVIVRDDLNRSNLVKWQSKGAAQAPTDEREAFENAVRAGKHHFPAELNRRDAKGSDRLGEYCRYEVEFAWRLWQDRAALASRTDGAAEAEPKPLNLLDLDARWKCCGGRMEQDPNGPWVQYAGESPAAEREASSRSAPSNEPEDAAMNARIPPQRRDQMTPP